MYNDIIVTCDHLRDEINGSQSKWFHGSFASSNNRGFHHVEGKDIAKAKKSKNKEKSGHCRVVKWLL